MPRSGFDRLARPYYLLERLTFGRALERCRTRQLPRMAAARRALVLGDGDGRFTAALLAANPVVQVVAVDSSPAMLALLAARAQRLGAATRLTSEPADALQYLRDLCRAGERADRFDLLTAHFFFDCLSEEQLRLLARTATLVLAPGALCVISEFATPNIWSRAVVALLYLAFHLLAGLRVQQLPPIRAALEEAGFVLVDEQISLHGLLTSTAWILAPG